MILLNYSQLYLEIHTQWIIQTLLIENAGILCNTQAHSRSQSCVRFMLLCCHRSSHEERCHCSTALSDCFNNHFSRTSLTTHYFPVVSSVSHNRVWNTLLHVHKIKSHSVRTSKHTPTASVSSLPSLINHFQNLMKLIVTSTSSTKRPLEGVLEPQCVQNMESEECWRSSQNVVRCYYW